MWVLIVIITEPTNREERRVIPQLGHRQEGGSWDGAVRTRRPRHSEDGHVAVSQTGAPAPSRLGGNQGARNARVSGAQSRGAHSPVGSASACILNPRALVPAPSARWSQPSAPAFHPTVCGNRGQKAAASRQPLSALTSQGHWRLLQLPARPQPVGPT